MRDAFAKIMRRFLNWVGESLGIAVPPPTPNSVNRIEQTASLEQKLRACNEALAAAANLRHVLQSQIETLEQQRQGIASDQLEALSRITADEAELEKRLADVERRCIEMTELRERIIRRAGKPEP